MVLFLAVFWHPEVLYNGLSFIESDTGAAHYLGSDLVSCQGHALD